MNKQNKHSHFINTMNSWGGAEGPGTDWAIPAVHKLHHIDYAPGMTPDPSSDDNDGRGPSLCHVDCMAAMSFLGALRDARLWPATVSPPTLGEIVAAMQGFRIPEYDDCDKCDFCEDVKGTFALGLVVVRTMWAERMWGLCLDCFNSGGVHKGGYQWEHGKGRARQGTV